MKATDYARTQIEGSLDFLAMCAKDMTDEQYNHNPSGTCNPAAKLHAHSLSAADFFVNGMLAGGTPKWAEMASNAGLPANARELWDKDVTISPELMNEYAGVVKKSVLAYLDTLTDEDLDREVDTQFMGKQTVAWVLQLAGSHTTGHAGEISAIKGVQGLKGLPF